MLNDNCPFERGGECPAAESTKFLWRPCDSQDRGAVCGPFLAQLETLKYYEAGYLNALDAEYPIEATFQMTKIPEGSAPEEIRSAWQNTKVALRKDFDEVAGKIKIHGADMVLALLARGEVDAAKWFQDTVAAFAEEDYDTTWWLFNPDEGVVTELDAPVSTVGMVYASTFQDALRSMKVPPLFAILEQPRPTQSVSSTTK